jgi:hypothetical protein
MRYWIAVLFVVATATPAYAWNALGHKVIAEIAWRELDPPTRQQIVDTLRRHPRFDKDFAAQMEEAADRGDKATQDHWIFQHAATWPDIARGIKGEEQKKFDHPVWHYIDFPLYASDQDRLAFKGKVPVNLSTEYPGTTPRDEYNVLQAIQDSQAVIKSEAGAEAKAVAYCWLMHLVGDIHQPLHSTALFSQDRFPTGDRGGNDIPLTQGRNLHALWDNLLGRQYYMRNVQQAVAEVERGSEYREVWGAAAKEMNPVKWAEESHKLCGDIVYSEGMYAAIQGVPKGEKLPPIALSPDYLRQAGRESRLRVVAAGVRLGVMLGGKPVAIQNAAAK